MLRTTKDLIANKLISIKDSINRVDDSKIIIEVNSKESGTGFFSPITKLLFAELRQACSLAPILHDFDLEYHF